MNLVSRPGRILARSLSMWCVYISGLLEIVPYIVPYLDAWIPAWASILFLSLSPFARIIAQRNLDAK